MFIQDLRVGKALGNVCCNGNTAILQYSGESINRLESGPIWTQRKVTVEIQLENQNQNRNTWSEIIAIMIVLLHY